MKVVKISKTNFDAYDSLYVEIMEKNKKYILGIVYRTPKQSKENHIMIHDEIISIIKEKMQ